MEAGKSNFVGWLASLIKEATRGSYKARTAAAVPRHPVQLNFIRAGLRKYAINLSFLTFGFFLVAHLLSTSDTEADNGRCKAAPWRGLGLALGTLGLLHWLASISTDLEILRWRAEQLEMLALAVCIIGQLTMLQADCPKNAVFVRGVTFLLCPWSRAFRVSSTQQFNAFMLWTVVLLVCFFRGQLLGEAWQWFLLAGCTFMWCTGLLSLRFKSDAAFEDLASTYKAMNSLLSMMADGLLLLDNEDVIVAVDQKAAHVLGKDIRSDWQLHLSAVMGNLGAAQPEGPAAVVGCATTTGGLVEGLSVQRLKTGVGEELSVEAYTARCLVQPHCIPFLLGHSTLAANLKSSTRLCALRVLHQCFDASPSASAPGGSGGAAPPTVPPAALAGPCLEADDDRPVAAAQLPAVPAATALAAGDADDRGDGVSVLSALTHSSAFAAGPGPPTLPPTFLDSPLKMTTALGIGGGEYTVVRNVASTGTTTVLQVKDNDGTHFALKRMKVPGILWQRDFTTNLRNLDREVRGLKALSWASGVIVCLTDCWIEADFRFACIVMEWLPLTLAGVLQNRTKSGLGAMCMEDVRRYMAHLSLGLAVIHNADIMHRDLKPSNILLTSSLQCCKIADLGVSRSLQSVGDGQRRQLPNWAQGAPLDMGLCHNQDMESVEEGETDDSRSEFSRYTHNVGTRAYASPESLAGGRYNQTVDIFSLGCVLFEMLTLIPVKLLRTDADPGEASLPSRAQQRFDEMPGASSAAVGRQGSRLSAADEACAELRQLCLQMLQPQPSRRPAAAAVATSTAALREPLLALLERCPELQRALAEAPGGAPPRPPPSLLLPSLEEHRFNGGLALPRPRAGVAAAAAAAE